MTNETSTLNRTRGACCVLCGY